MRDKNLLQEFRVTIVSGDRAIQVLSRISDPRQSTAMCSKGTRGAKGKKEKKKGFSSLLQLLLRETNLPSCAVIG